MAPSSRRKLWRARLAQIEPLDRALRQLRRTDEIEALQSEVRSLRDATPNEPDGPSTIVVRDSVAPFLREVPPGHFYSPVPDLLEIAAQADRLFSPSRPLPGVELRAEEQRERFRTLAALAREAPLPRTATPPARFSLDNPNYEIGDASMLAAMLRHLRPRRYLEVGSGYSTVLALDVSERFLEGELSVTAIEPYPELLETLARPDDRASGRLEVLAQPVQEVALERFRALEENDVLFLDSSHVLKTGSDIQYLYTAVLPVLAPGVYVHIHDIFWPFEYLRHWVELGRAWNECYLLHAFLLFNEAFEVVLWNHYLAVEHRDLIATELPEMFENTGGAFWMRRRA